jgi:hypothetical protein
MQTENTREIWQHYARMIREARPDQIPFLIDDMDITVERLIQQAMGDLAMGDLFAPASWAAIRGETPPAPLNEQAAGLPDAPHAQPLGEMTYWHAYWHGEGWQK